MTLLTAALLSACSGASNVAPTVTAQIPSTAQFTATTPLGAAAAVGTSAIAERGALAIARGDTAFNRTLPVAPSSLKFTVPMGQLLTVTVKSKTVVYAASGNPKIATVTPSFVEVKTLANGSGTAVFTVAIHAVGSTSIGLLDHQRMSTTVPVTVTGASKIYVVNGNHTITTYNVNGTQTTPTIRLGLNLPYRIAVDAAGKIYVLNYPNTVTTFNQDGTQTTPTFTVPPYPGANADYSTALTVDGAGKIYVANYVDPGNSNAGRVTTFKPDGTRTTPTIIAGLANPTGIAVDAAGKIYVSNNSNMSSTHYDSSVTTYLPDGTETTPTIVAAREFLDYPNGVAVDGAGNIYVACSYYGLDIVNATDTQGTSIATDSGFGGVAVDAAGKIYALGAGVIPYNLDGTQSGPIITDGSNGGISAFAIR